MSEYTQDEKRFEARDYEQMGKTKMHPAVYVRAMESGLGWHRICPDDPESPEVYCDIAAIRVFMDYHESVVAGWMEDNRRLREQEPSPSLVLKPKKEKVASVPAGESKGKLAYDLRGQGFQWSAITEVKNPLVSAKKYAKSNGLPWPPQSIGIQ